MQKHWVGGGNDDPVGHGGANTGNDNTAHAPHGNHARNSRAGADRRWDSTCLSSSGYNTGGHGNTYSMSNNTRWCYYRVGTYENDNCKSHQDKGSTIHDGHGDHACTQYGTGTDDLP